MKIDLTLPLFIILLIISNLFLSKLLLLPIIILNLIIISTLVTFYQLILNSGNWKNIKTGKLISGF